MNIQSHEFVLPRPCRYYIANDEPNTSTALVLALHGYGSNPETMLRLTRPSVDASVLVAALEGPNQHYTQDGPGGGVAAYNWGIKQHHADAVATHHAMLQHALVELQTQYRLTPKQCFLAGFSQAVGFNYRFLGTHPGAVGGVIAICGGVPKDWESSGYADFTTPILHISRSEDEFFPKSFSEAMPARLRSHAQDVEFHMLPGMHRYPSNAREFIRPFMRRVLSMA